MAEITFLTPEGKIQLEEKLKYMKEVLRPEVQRKIGIAREYGDLSENSEYDQAREEQGKLETEIIISVHHKRQGFAVENDGKVNVTVLVESTGEGRSEDI